MRGGGSIESHDADLVSVETEGGCEELRGVVKLRGQGEVGRESPAGNVGEPDKGH
jgi:hypothetical protein